MRRNALLSLLALVLTALTVQGGCVIIPEVKSKFVELVASGTVCDTLEAAGVLNTHDDVDDVDLGSLNIPALLDDAGIDVGDVDSIAVFGITYKTTRPDPDPAREIVNGQVTVKRGSGTGPAFVPTTAEVVVISSFDQVVNAATTDQTAPVSAAGIALLNDLLQDLLDEAKGQGVVLDRVIRYHVTGTSNPQGVESDFAWRICVKVNIKGEVEVDVVE